MARTLGNRKVSRWPSGLQAGLSGPMPSSRPFFIKTRELEVIHAKGVLGLRTIVERVTLRHHIAEHPSAGVRSQRTFHPLYNKASLTGVTGGVCGPRHCMGSSYRWSLRGNFLC
ncbi:hypothetical protein PoB_002992300 [Plakobranchus ocellatus]|uniref:Uncharacterized protein n=1 Tax=Plakobranchus ocellatus TaxID=259542 RepID=A0AAV4A9U9_9GAST|nr:hypothetical protein PoB_002992300 [Plakobranchus ocellatus]